MRRTLRLTAVALTATFALAACSSDKDEASTTSQAPETTMAADTTMPAAEPKDIVDTAVAAGSFTTLATALDKAGLVETLKGPGPFTVFAPTDDAFKALPAGALDGLLAKPDDLKDVLLYHVVKGKVMAADVVKITEAEMANGKKVTIKVDGEIGRAHV